MEPFEITVRHGREYSDIIVVTLKGELEYESIECIHETFKKIHKKGRELFVIVDFSKVTSISSAAIGELRECQTQLNEQDGNLVLTGMKLSVLEQINTRNGHKKFEIYNDIQSAKNSYIWVYKNRSDHVSITIPSLLTFVPPTRQMIGRIAGQKGYSNRDTFRIETIVDEICNNAVEHGHPSKHNSIHLQLAINRLKLELHISNTSDPSKIPSLKKNSDYISKPEPFLNNIRGRGLALVKMLSSDFSINSSEEETYVHVTKLREE